MPINCSLKCKKIISEPGQTTFIVDLEFNSGGKLELELEYRNEENPPNLPLGKEIFLMEEKEEE